MKSIREKLEPDEEIICQSHKSIRAGIEILIGLLVGTMYLGMFQNDVLKSTDIFLKSIFLIGILIIFLEGVNSFFSEVILTNKRIFIKNIFSLGNFSETYLSELKNIKITSKPFKDSLNRGSFILFRKKKYPIWVAAVTNIDILNEKIKEIIKFN
jgi:hypothetical protein